MADEPLPGRCRICTANDENALVEEIAEAMWLTQARSTNDDEWRAWAKAGPYWQGIMRNFARASVGVLRRDFVS